MNELPWHRHRELPYSLGLITRHLYNHIYTITSIQSHLYNHMLTTQHLYYNIKHSRGEARWSLSKSATRRSTSRNTLNVPSRTIKRRLNTISRTHTYIAQCTVCKSVLSAKTRSVPCAEKRVVYKNCHIHNVHTNVHTNTLTHNVHSDAHFALPNTQAFTQDI